MRPVLPAANRLHPNYTVDPATDIALQNALNELLRNAQEEATVDRQIENLRAQGYAVPRKKPVGIFNGYSNNDAQRLQEIRNSIAAILAGPTNDANQVRKLCFLAEMERLYGVARTSYKRLIGQYTNAHQDLIRTLGYYCSYCGIPVGIGVHVEHKLPKLSYPNRAILWDNFLLACDNCNASKGEKPSRLTGAAIANPIYNVPLPPLAGALAPATETQIATGSLSAYIWADDPNFTCMNAFSFRLMRVQYNLVNFLSTRTAAQEIPPDQLEVWVKNGGIQRMPPYTGNVIVGQFDNNPANLWEVELHVTAINSTAPQVVAAAQTVINELHLNRDQNDLRYPYNSDLRVPLRTDAWFKAVIGIYRLRRAYLRDRGNFGPGYQDLEDVVIENAVSSGFWFVWVKVINTYIEADHLRTKLLNRFFDQALFPGTNRPPFM